MHCAVRREALLSICIGSGKSNQSVLRSQRMKFSAQLKGKLRSSSQPSPTAGSLHDGEDDLSGIEIEARKVSEMDLDRECILERSRLVSEAPARMPYIGFFGKYNKRWYVDIVSLPHNSIRTFISEVFSTLTSVHRLALDMTDADFQKLFYFLEEFQKYTQTVLEAEEKILYPEVDGALKKRLEDPNHALHPKTRAERKRQISELLLSLTDNELRAKRSVTIASTLQRNMDELSRKLLDYFSAKEAELPKVLFGRAVRGSKEKNRMEKRLIKLFAEHKVEFHYTALLALPLHSEDVRADFEDRHFTKSERTQFRDAVKQVQQSLFAIPRAFEDAARGYEARFSMAAFLEHYGKDRDADATTQIV